MNGDTKSGGCVGCLLLLAIAALVMIGSFLSGYFWTAGAARYSSPRECPPIPASVPLER